MASNATPSSIPSWTVADLLDFEGMLADDQAEEIADAALRNRERDIVEESIRPRLSDEGVAALDPDAPIAERRRVFRLWLAARREQQAKDNSSSGRVAVSPGEAFVGSRWLVALIFGGLSLFAGIGVVSSILHREQRYFNVVLFLAITLLPQLALLLALGVGWLLRGRKSEKAAGVFQVIVRKAVDALSEKALTRKVGAHAERSWRTLRRRPYLGWSLAVTTQTAAVLFNIGLLIAFVTSLLVMDLRFFWESTPAMEATNSLKAVVDALAAPWSWALPDLLPSGEEIEATRIMAVNDFTERADSAKVWVPFLMLTLAVWGLAPRLLLRVVVAWLGKKSVQRYAFNERSHRELWRRMTELRLTTPVTGPRDDAIVLLWGGSDPDSDSLRTALLQQVRWNPVVTVPVGGLDPAADHRAVDDTVEKLRAAKRPIRIALVADSWGLVPRDLGEFLKKLRQAVGDGVSILCFLVGAPKGDDASRLASPTDEEIKVWENFASELDDSSLRIHPYRTAGEVGEPA
jgi:hypothetical protein